MACGAKTPSAHGSVKVHLDVGRNGAVNAATLRQSPDPALGACVVDVLKAAKFPPTQAGGAFTSGYDF
jgi:TonB family protein